MIRGGYHNGFAPRDMDPLYPQLWAGCVGAWNPGLGPTGATIFDWGRKNAGVLTNATTATAWNVVKGNWCFTGNGTNSYVNISGVDSLLTGLSQCTLCFWVNRVISQATAVIRGAQNVSRFGVIWFTDNYIYASCEGGTTSYNYYVAPMAGLVHVAMIYDGTLSGSSKIRVAINGADLTLSGAAFPLTMPTTIPSPSAIGMSIGADKSTNGGIYSPHSYTDVMIFNRVLKEKELSLIAQHPGIAYTPRVRPAFSVAQSFNPAWAAQRPRMIGGGLV